MLLLCLKVYNSLVYIVVVSLTIYSLVRQIWATVYSPWHDTCHFGLDVSVAISWLRSRVCALLARVAQAVPATHKCKTISYTSSCTVALLYFVHYTVTNVRVLCMPKILSTWPILTLTGVLMDSLHTYIVCGGTYSLTSYAAPWRAIGRRCCQHARPVAAARPVHAA